MIVEVLAPNGTDIHRTVGCFHEGGHLVVEYRGFSFRRDTESQRRRKTSPA